MNKKISEPAFPGERLVMSAGYKTKEREPVAGMTLRDYFAAKAMQGEFAAQDRRNDGNGVGIISSEDMIKCAKYFYEMADVMLEAREWRDIKTVKVKP